MTDQELDMMVALGAIPEEQALLMKQRQSAEALMGAPSAQGRNVGATYVASSPLEHLSVALQRGMGAQRTKRADEAMEGTFERQTQGRRAGLKAYQEQQARETAMLLEAMRRRDAQPVDPATAAPGAAGWIDLGFVPGIA